MRVIQLSGHGIFRITDFLGLHGLHGEDLGMVAYHAKIIPILKKQSRIRRLIMFVNVRGAMNCATTNATSCNEELSFRNGIIPYPKITF